MHAHRRTEHVHPSENDFRCFINVSLVIVSSGPRWRACGEYVQCAKECDTKAKKRQKAEKCFYPAGLNLAWDARGLLEVGP